MYGLEQQKKKKVFFDLEKEINEKPTRKKELMEQAATRINTLKQQLREGQTDSSFDQLGILLHGYNALQKVLKKINRTE